MDRGQGSDENVEHNNNNNNNSAISDDHHQVEERRDDDEAKPKVWSNLPVLAVANILDKLVEPADRLQVSAACKSWRDTLYQPCLWPNKHLNLNLCSYKFLLSGQAAPEIGTGIHAFNFLPYSKRPNHEQDNTALRQFLCKCAHLLHSITIYFDPNSRNNVIDLLDIVRYLAEDRKLNYQDNDGTSKDNQRQQPTPAFANCRSLRSFSLCPVTAQTRMDEPFLDLYWELTEALEHFISKIEHLEHISFGSLEAVLANLDGYLNVFYEKGHYATLRCLHLGTMKSNVRTSEPNFSSSISNVIQHFTALRSLTLDFDLLDARLIASLASFDQLQSITINVHRVSLSNQPRMIPNDAWDKVHASLPKLKATVNLLNTNYLNNLIELLLDSLMESKLPIETFAAYYVKLGAEGKLRTLLEKLARHNKDNLRRLVLVNHVGKPRRLVDQGTNPLTMLVWQCRDLQEITIFGFILDDLDLLAIARLRGEHLRQLNVPASCVKLTHQLATVMPSTDNIDRTYFDNFDHRWFYNTAPSCKQRAVRISISEPLKRDWSPVLDHDIPTVMFNSTKYSQLTYHRPLLEQECPCKEN